MRVLGFFLLIPQKGLYEIGKTNIYVGKLRSSIVKMIKKLIIFRNSNLVIITDLLSTLTEIIDPLPLTYK